MSELWVQEYFFNRRTAPSLFSWRARSRGVSLWIFLRRALALCNSKSLMTAVLWETAAWWSGVFPKRVAVLTDAPYFTSKLITSVRLYFAASWSAVEPSLLQTLGETPDDKSRFNLTRSSSTTAFIRSRANPPCASLFEQSFLPSKSVWFDFIPRWKVILIRYEK